MSDIRRLNQAKKAAPSFGARLVSILREHKRAFLAVIGIPSVADLLREFGRAKAMDLIYQNLGVVGVWLATYRLVGLTLGLAAVIAWIIISILREGESRESIILDANGNPYEIRTISKKWRVSVAFGGCLCLAILGYGAYSFYRISPETLLSQFPHGYVVFGIDSSNSVFPYQDRTLERWTIDWSPVHATQTPTTITIRMPDIYFKESGISIGGNSLMGAKKVGFFPSPKANFFRDGNVRLRAEILSYSKKGVVFALGFSPDQKQ